jgi:glycosyltransferase involved in cell wall biosynthesis
MNKPNETIGQADSTLRRHSSGKQRARVCVVIPALKEEHNLPYVPTRIPNDIDDIVLVDERSVDNTAFSRSLTMAEAVRVPEARKRKGNAHLRFAAASRDIIVMIDEDGNTDPQEIQRYVTTLVSDPDFARGSRFIEGGITKFRRFGNWSLHKLVNLLLGTKYTDLCYGYNAFRRRCLETVRTPNVIASAHEEEALIV